MESPRKVNKPSSITLPPLRFFVQFTNDSRKIAQREKIPQRSRKRSAPLADSSSGPDDHRQLLLNRIKPLSPAGFERLCQRLLRESDFQHVEVTGRSGDGSIDGAGIFKSTA